MSHAQQQTSSKISQPTTVEGNIPEFLTLPPDGVPISLAVTYDEGMVFTASSGEKGRNLSWQAGGYALFLTFVLEDQRVEEAVAVTPNCWFSSCFQTSDAPLVTKQSCCAPSVPGIYHFGFKVRLAPGSPLVTIVDPQIIITPIIIDATPGLSRKFGNSH